MIVELDGHGRPVKIGAINPIVSHFDKTGGMQRSLEAHAMEGLETYEALLAARRACAAEETQQQANPGSVVDMAAQFRRKRWAATYRWGPGPKEITQMTDFIWRPGPKRRMQKKRPRLAIVRNATLGKGGQNSTPWLRGNPERAQRLQLELPSLGLLPATPTRVDPNPPQ